MKKGLYLFVVLTTIVCCLCACATQNVPAATTTDKAGAETSAGAVSEQSKPSAAAAEPEYVLKFGYGEAADPKTSLEHVAATHFKEYIERESNGRISVQLYPGGTLGDSEALIQQVQIGSVQGCPTADAKLATMFPPIQCLSIPYLFDNREVAFKVLDGPIGQEIKDGVLAATGMRILTIGENGGFRCFSNNTREIHSPADSETPARESTSVRTRQRMLVNLTSSYIQNSIALAAILTHFGKRLNTELDTDTLAVLNRLRPIDNQGTWLETMQHMLHLEQPDETQKTGS